MANGPNTNGPRHRGQRLAVFLALFAVALAAAGWAGGWFRPSTPEPPPVADAPLPAPADPRLTFDTPFRNVRPGVKYVGDAVCAECHREVADTYHHHPMARTLAPANAPGGPPLDASARNPFDSGNVRFEVVAPGGAVAHRLTYRDAGGKEVARLEHPIAFAVGSGQRGHSYLFLRDGCLFQSPVSWFSQKRIWDESPGGVGKMHPGRPVGADCMYCHANEPRPVAGTLNRFEGPPFRGAGIGCERCHGPGELHVAAREPGRAVEGVDYSIVNPKHLEPGLREAVCQQCHLQGVVRVLRRGRDHFDFRPGLPFDSVWRVFVTGGDPQERRKAVSHVEQLGESACFQKSNGKLGCATCHDPHRVPEPAEKAAFFRQGCLKCHAPAACSLPETAAERKAVADACAACHMPRYANADAAHTAATDHFIPRKPQPPSAPRPGPAVLEPFPAGDPAELDRDLGVAAARLAREGRVGPAGLVHDVTPLLAAAARADPDDLDAWDAWGFDLQRRGRAAEAADAYTHVLARSPGREGTLVLAATLAGERRRDDEAEGYWGRAVALSPARAGYRLSLASILRQRGELARAEAECRVALKLAPGETGARMALVDSLLTQGKRDEAAAEFETLRRLAPAGMAEIEKWYRGAARR